MVTIVSYFQELTQEEINKLDTRKRNTAAKNLGDFVNKTKVNGGYYLARYEASKGSDNKVKSQYNKAAWTNISQPDTATNYQNMYSENSYIESDLVNSYSWDTAIVFIQKYSGNSNYAGQKSKSTVKANTGLNNDEVCNIHDMASGNYEYNTEHSEQLSNGSYGTQCPCVLRGGCAYGVFSTSLVTAWRGNNNIRSDDKNGSFRDLFWLKD